MMPQQSLVDIFEDCVNRIAVGQPIEACLALYPDHAARLRPLLENAETIKAMRAPQTELVEDQALVWQQIAQAMPVSLPRRGRGYRVGLLAAILLLLFLLTATWFVLTRPDLPPEDSNIIGPLTETVMPTLSATPSATPTITQTSTLTLSATPMQTATPTSTVRATTIPTQIAMPTSTPTTAQLPTATFAPGCGAPLTEQDAIDRVLEIYPNTTVTSISQQVRFEETLVWVVQTSHQIEVTIDVACSVILTIEQIGDDNLNEDINDNNTNVNTNDNQNANDNIDDNGGMGSDDNSNQNANDNADDDSGSGGSGMGSDD